MLEKHAEFLRWNESLFELYKFYIYFTMFHVFTRLVS